MFQFMAMCFIFSISLESQIPDCLLQQQAQSLAACLPRNYMSNEHILRTSVC